jgi:hypothetical protein
MPNPFKRQGSSFQQGRPDIWTASNIGLLGLLEVELARELPSTIALVGDIGSGKTTALSAYKARMAEACPRDFFIEIDMGKTSPETWPDLTALVYAQMIGHVGAKEHDAVAKELKVSAHSAHKYVQQHEMYALLKGMIEQRAKAGARAHVLVDECQRPAEHYEHEKDTAKLHSWFEQLKNLAEAISQGRGQMVITMTTSPWESGPSHVRDRFVELRAEAPNAAEIQAFVEEGLKHTGGDKPDRAEEGLGEAMKGNTPELITPRQLHGRLWEMWRKAHKLGAGSLSATHQ